MSTPGVDDGPVGAPSSRDSKLKLVKQPEKRIGEDCGGDQDAERLRWVRRVACA